MKNMFENEWGYRNSIWFNEERDKFNYPNNSVFSNTSTSLRDVEIIITNKIIDKYEARSYPDDDYDNNGKIELYEVDVYQVEIKGKDNSGNTRKLIHKAPRFMPYWNDPLSPNKNYKTKGWVNAGLSSARNIVVTRYIPNYQVRNRFSPGKGAIVLWNAFYIHAGPADLFDIGFGSAGCIEIIGNYDDFKSDIESLSGHKGSSDDAILALVKNRKLIVKIEGTNVPDIKSKFTREL